ncbi:MULTISPECIES: ABC transporter permease [unclassified Streptomyces]|uniref:ABC transporter permease n=1 Tax=unclassified Streptomyces TaxID=2593676 RepID=UPI002E33DFB9|nr:MULTISPECIES: ABC transporter permease [unclassified Streptomyces]WUC68710.1 ABC transporter permease [Streptomyces sp. NBC_00539]
MIALPIVGVSAVDLTWRSSALSVEQSLSRQIGAADAKLTKPSYDTALYQNPAGDRYEPVGGYRDYDATKPKLEDVPVASVLPPGAQIVQDSHSGAKVRTTHGLLDTELREVDTASPLVEGLLTLKRGRMPSAAGEVIATDKFLEESGFFVGSELTPRGAARSYRIVGAYELPSALNTTQIIAPPRTLLAPLDRALTGAGGQGLSVDDSFLVKVGGDGFTWNMVRAANAKGLLALSRAANLHPPADSEVPLYAQQREEDRDGDYSGASTKAVELTVLATVVGLAMLEVCLLAGPAFAVGARRSARQLGLVGANGGDRRHIRAIVLSGGLVIGAASAVVGTALGVALTLGLRPVLEEYLGLRWGGFEVRPLELLAVALVAVLTGLLAAVVPAVTASRQTVLASLTGRRGVRRANRVLPLIGIVAVAAGAALALYGAVSAMGTVVVAGGSALAELGVVALTPTLVGLFGRAGRWLPLSPRLALRDAVRNRGRTAPAVAAVLAAVAGTVAVATYQHSTELQARHEYVASLPAGAGMLTNAEDDRYKDVPAARQALAKEFSLAVRADVDRVVVGKPSCDAYSTEPGCGRLEIVMPPENRCPLYESKNVMSELSMDQVRALRRDWRCTDRQFMQPRDTVVADEKLLTVLGVSDPGAVAALRSGQAVSFDRRNFKEGKVTMQVITDDARGPGVPGAGDQPKDVKVFPVYQAPDSVTGYGIEIVLPPGAVKAAGLGTAPFGTYFTLADKPTGAQRQALAAMIDRIGVDAPVRIEEGYQGRDSVEILALTIFAGLVTIGAAGIATGLAQADAEADLKTLAAVGAPPRVRRTLSGFQCGVVALMGVALGTAAGLLPAAGLRLTERRALAGLITHSGSDQAVYVPFAVPWETLGGLLILVPLGAAVLAALVTRSSGALARRATG